MGSCLININVIILLGFPWKQTEKNAKNMWRDCITDLESKLIPEGEEEELQHIKIAIKMKPS